jgi:hypothetical protein
MDPNEMLVTRFERALDLPAYLESRCFRLVETGNQSREHIAMEGPRGEALLVQKDATRNVWTYTDLAPRSPSSSDTRDSTGRRPWSCSSPAPTSDAETFLPP